MHLSREDKKNKPGSAKGVLWIFTILLAGLGLKSPSENDPVRVQKSWQGAFLSEVQGFAPANADLELWGIFTSGGWSDSGQFLAISQGSAHNFYYIPPNYLAPGGNPPRPAIFSPQLEKDKNTWILAAKGWEFFSKPLKADTWQAFNRAAQGFMALESLPSRAFDGLEVEFIHGFRRKGVLLVDKRVYINTPDEVAGKKHRQALDDFFKIPL